MADKPAVAKIPFSKPFVAGKELYYIAQAVDKLHLSGDGEFTKRCHAWLERVTGAKKALLTHSGTAALEMSALLSGVGPGDEVILPSFTFVTSANAFVLRGAVPVFVDIRPDTLNIDEKLIEQAITPKTKAIVPVHYAGVPCEMDAILAIAKKHNLLVIEDAAQGLQTSYKGKALGVIGDMGCLSFHETKNLISGEGGAILLRDDTLVERAEIIREKGTNRSKFFRGQVDKYTWVDLGSSYLPGELTAAFLYAQFEQAEPITAERRRLVQRYEAMLAPLGARGVVDLPPAGLHEVSNGHMMYCLSKTADERPGILDYLKGQGISSVFHYVPLHSSPGGMKYGRTATTMEVTDSVADRIFRLPMYHGLTEEDQDRVIAALYSYFKVPGPNR